MLRSCDVRFAHTVTTETASRNCLSVCLFVLLQRSHTSPRPHHPPEPATGCCYLRPPPSAAWKPTRHSVGARPPSALLGGPRSTEWQLGNRARPSTQRVHLGSRKTQFSVVRTGSRPSVSPLRSIECQHLHRALGSLVEGTALLSVIAQEFHRATQRCMAPL